MSKSRTRLTNLVALIRWRILWRLIWVYSFHRLVWTYTYDNYGIARVVHILRNFAYMCSHKTFINSFGAKFRTTFVVCFSFLTNYSLKRSLYVKLKDWMSNSVDPDETAHMSCLIWIYTVCKSLLWSLVAVKELKCIYYTYEYVTDLLHMLTIVRISNSYMCVWVSRVQIIRKLHIL